MPKSERRAFILGLDGVPWNRLNNWIATGELPNFSRLFEEGATGPLRSTIAPTTALAWPSISTGVWPDKHGIYHFRRITSDYDNELNTSDDVTAVRLWDIVSPAVVGNVPMTFPARDIEGSMVTGMMTPNLESKFTHPSSLASDVLKEIPEYRIGLDWGSFGARREEFRHEIDSLLDSRRKLMHYLLDLEEWQLAFFVFTEPDRFQHLFWQDHELRSFYAKIDEIVGEAMERAERAGATLYVVSDHGFGPVDKHVNLNTVLSKSGFLQKSSSSSSTLDKLGITKDTILSSLGRVGARRKVLENLPKSVVDFAATTIPGTHGRYDVDFKNSIAFAYGYGNVFINDSGRFERGIVNPAEREELAKEVGEALESATDPVTGEPMVDVFYGRDVFPNDDDSPDVIAVAKEGYSVRNNISDSITSVAETESAAHQMTGIFAAWGDEIRPDTQLDELQVVDVAPTVLHGLAKPVPYNRDGNVIRSLFEPGTPPCERDIEEREYQLGVSSRETGVNQGDSDVEERLRGLGYLS